jgi:hypothetical protein
MKSHMISYILYYIDIYKKLFKKAMWELILIDNQQTIHITRFASVIQLQKKKNEART